MMLRLQSFVVLLLVAVTIGAASAASRSVGRPQSSALAPNFTHTKVVMLGTGNPVADPERWGPATAVVVDDQSYLVDAGVGIVRRAANTGLPALGPANLRRVFITHLHSDHTLGLPDLMLSPWVLGRATPLEAYGPPGLAEMTKSIETAWRDDIDMRLYGGEPTRTKNRNYHAIAHEIQAGRVYEDAKVKIDAIPVLHGTWPEAFGYRFETAERVIVISGDTRPAPALVEACNGCDVLIHEVYSAEREKSAVARQPYDSAFHTSTMELVEIAKKAHPRLLVLYHLGGFTGTAEQLEREIKQAGYTGLVVAASDLDVY